MYPRKHNILAYRSQVEQILAGRIPRPQFVDLHTSNRCNHRCQGCAYGKMLDGKIMSWANHFNIIRQYMDFGVKAFDFAGGGEPLTLPYFRDLTSHIIAQGGHYGIITNGTLLTKALIAHICRTATYIRISLEASNPTDYCSYKDVSLTWWNRCLDNIRQLARMNEDLEEPCEVGIKFSVGKSLRGPVHYREAIELGLDLGVSNIQFKALRHEPEELSLEEKKNEAGALQYVQSQFPNASTSSWIVPVPNENVPICGLSPLHSVVDYLGNVYICCYYYYRSQTHLIGNMLETPLADLWGSEAHRWALHNIQKSECAKVDCKFFGHHELMQEAKFRGKWYWL